MLDREPGTPRRQPEPFHPIRSHQPAPDAHQTLAASLHYLAWESPEFALADSADNGSSAMSLYQEVCADNPPSLGEGCHSSIPITCDRIVVQSQGEDLPGENLLFKPGGL